MRRVALWPLLAMLLVGCVLIGLIHFLLDSARWVEHSDDVLSHAYAVEATLLDMQGALRGYQATRDPGFLATYEQGDNLIDGETRTLLDLVVDNPSQQEAARGFQLASSQWREFGRELRDRIRAGAGADDPALNVRGREGMEQVRARIAAFTEAEQNLRLERAGKVDRVRTGLFAGIAAAVILLGGAAAFWIRSLLNRVTSTYRASAEEARRWAEELRVTLRSIGDAVISTDPDGRVVFLNPVAEQLTGWATAEAAGKALDEVFVIFNEENGEPAKNPVERVLRELRVVGLANHTVLRARDGREIPIEDSAAPILAENGEIRGVILIFHDVTERRKAEEVLRESEAQRTAIIQEAPIGTMLVDGDLRLLQINPKGMPTFSGMKNPLGRTIEEIARIQWPKETADEIIARFRHTLETGEAFFASGFAEERIDRHRREYYDWELHRIALPGGQHGIVCYFTDISAHVFAQREIQESADRLRFMAESMPQKIFTAKPNGEIDYFNRQWMEFTGLSFEEIRDWGWLQFIHPDDVDENVRRWQHSVDTGEKFYLEHRFRRADGAWRWHVSRARPMRDEQGNVLMWIGSNTDIEEIRQAQAEVERASRTKDEFLAALSHELRTPLTPVLMTLSTLRDETRLPLDVREQISMMKRNIELEARLIDDLLDLTRIAKGKLELRVEECDAHSLVALAIEMVRSEALRKRQTVEVDLAAQRSQISGDPARLQQVFWNVLKNAVKFTAESGRLAVRTRDAEHQLIVEVSDTGIGIEPESIERIFLPFEQGAALSTEHRFGGLGLGLSISKAIVELHGGAIRAASVGQGAGATFRVELPASENTFPLITDGSRVIENGDRLSRVSEQRQATPLRLLLVEDNEPTLAVLERLLTRAGHSVTTAMTVAGALATAAGPVRFDAVISDVGLPDGTGFDLMEKLQITYGLRGIALSGYGMDEDLRRSREAGFAMHLTKPIDFAQLEQALTMLMADAPAT